MHILQKVSLNRNPHKTRLGIDQLMNMLGPRFTGTKPCISLRNSSSVFVISVL